MRKVCIVVGSRANYSSIKSVMRAVQKHPELKLQVVAGASALLDRFGAVVDTVIGDGFMPDARVHMIIEGENPTTMAKSTGLGLLELPTVFEQLNPDVVVTVGDRFETMATAIAAAYMNIPLAHTMGGEISGTIDESIRHAITKLAHIHFPANPDAAKRILRMGEDPTTVHITGCPRIDLVAEISNENSRLPERSWLEMEGVGGQIDLDAPFLLVSQHPVTTEYGDGERHIEETLMALHELKMPTIMLWPNVDAGSEDISRGMRKFRERYDHDYIRFYKNFAVETYVRLMKRCACKIGNSSASIREGPFLGMPAVNVGTRQIGRERGSNVIDVDHDRHQIMTAIRKQLDHGSYEMEPIYGDGQAGKRIADILSKVEVTIQKRITY
jgi:UDP-hydrolysing UDP-N-acetyl-D-glucosamine 2-epimerase